MRSTLKICTKRIIDHNKALLPANSRYKQLRTCKGRKDELNDDMQYGKGTTNYHRAMQDMFDQWDEYDNKYNNWMIE